MVRQSSPSTRNGVWASAVVTEIDCMEVGECELDKLVLWKSTMLDVEKHKCITSSKKLSLRPAWFWRTTSMAINMCYRDGWVVVNPCSIGHVSQIANCIELSIAQASPGSCVKSLLCQASSWTKKQLTPKKRSLLSSTHALYDPKASSKLSTRPSTAWWVLLDPKVTSKSSTRRQLRLSFFYAPRQA